MLLTILLQEQPTFLKDLADQALSLAILAFLAWMLWKRQQAQEDKYMQRIKELEDKLNNYLDGDRATMMQVITNNTKAFEQLSEHFEHLK